MHKLTTALVVLALGAIAPVIAQNGNTPVCYGTQGSAKIAGTNTYQTNGVCKDLCRDMKKAVWGVTKGSTCYCANAVPPKEDKVDDSECDVPCQGYPQEICGGNLSWSFGYTGVVPPEEDTASSSTTAPGSSTTSNAPVQTTVVNGEVTVTAPPNPDNQQSGGGGSVAPIAAGAVVGVVAVIALGVGAFLFVRRNRRRQAEEEYRAAVAAKEFTASIRKPQQDSRLDPVMLQQRRLSDGSIADNEDYSRRILKVTNPDA